MNTTINPTTSAIFPISPERFWRAFSENLGPKHDEISYCYNQRGERTAYMKNFLNELGQFLSLFNCNVDYEWFARFDVCYFDRIAPTDWEEWPWEVAIEQENAGSWHEELCKLMVVNAGLKVLIAYSLPSRPV